MLSMLTNDFPLKVWALIWAEALLLSSLPKGMLLHPLLNPPVAEEGTEHSAC